MAQPSDADFSYQYHPYRFELLTLDSKAGKPIKLLAIPSGDVFEIEKTVDPYWLLADNLEQLHYNRERYVDYKQCEKVISLDNGGRFQRKFCSDYC